MAAIVYVLCFLTSLACAVLLLRGYRKTGARLLFWSGLCFIGFALNNALLFVDRVIVPNQDLQEIRSVPTLLGVLVLVFGLIWESE